MKRLLIAVPLLGAASWAGATLYAGNQAQTAYGELLEQLKVQHGLHVEPLDYDKNFLGSRVKTVVNGGSGSLSAAKDLPEPLRSLAGRFVLDHEIEHGPMVLSNGLQALAGRIKTTLDMDSLDPDFAQRWKEACACEEPVVLLSEISLQGEYSHAFTVASLDWRDGDKHVTFGGLRSQARVDSDKSARSSGEIGRLSLRWQQGSSLQVEPGQWQLDGTEAIKHIVVGEGVFSLPAVHFTQDGKVAEFQGIKALFNTEIQDGLLNSSFDVGLDVLKGPAGELQDTHLSFSLDGITASALSDFSGRLAMTDLSSDSAAQIELLQLYRGLIAPGIAFKYGLRGNHAAGGDFDASIAMKYDPAGGVSFASLQTVGDLVEAIKGDVSVAFDQGLLSVLPEQLKLMIPSTFESLEGRYVLKAELSEGQAAVNGDPVPLAMMFGAQFAQPLPSLEEVALAMQVEK